MTADVVIAGKGGFIGGILSSTLAEQGIEAVDVWDFIEGTGSAKVLVNLANIPDNPAADLALLNSRIALIGGRVRHWLQAQSFITLHGRGGLDPSRFNAGFTPMTLDRYSVGKLAEERRLSSVARAGGVGQLTFAYLPAVLDDGGSWSRAREQAKRNGYLLPPGMSRGARANFAYVADLVDLVVARTEGGDPAQISRVVVNDPLSRTVTWSDFLGARQLSLGEGGGPATLKRTARYAKGELFGRLYAAAAAVERLGPPGPEPTVGEPGEPVMPAEPLAFAGVLRHVVRHQAFLPSTPYR